MRPYQRVTFRFLLILISPVWCALIFSRQRVAWGQRTPNRHPILTPDDGLEVLGGYCDAHDEHEQAVASLSGARGCGVPLQNGVGSYQVRQRLTRHLVSLGPAILASVARLTTRHEGLEPRGSLGWSRNVDPRDAGLLGAGQGITGE